MKKYIIMFSMLFTCSIFLMACAGNSAKDDSEENGEGGLPETIEIDTELRENGVDLTIERITFEDHYIVVDFHAVNTTGHGVELAAQGISEEGEADGLILEDDTGHTYTFVAEGSDQRVGFLDKEKIEGSLHFAGELQDEAETLKLMFNPDEDQSNDRTPIFTFENIKINR